MSIGCTTWCDCDCDCELQLQHIGVADMIAANGFCTHFVQQVSVTPYTHPTTPIVVDSVAVAPCERALRIKSTPFLGTITPSGVTC